MTDSASGDDWKCRRARPELVDPDKNILRHTHSKLRNVSYGTSGGLFWIPNNPAQADAGVTQGI